MNTSSPDRIEQYTRQGWWGDVTLHELLWRNAAANPDLLAVADQPNRESLTDGPTYRLSYAELDNAAVNLASQLLDLGIGPGDALIVQLPNIAELAVIYYAASMIGAIVSPLPVQYGAHELGMAAAALSPAAIITVERVKNDRLADVAHKLFAGSVPVLVFGSAAGDSPSPGLRYLQLDPQPHADNRRQVEQHLQQHPADANATLTVCWTSGTTGTPKGVPRSHNMWLATGRNSAEAGQYRPGDRLLNPFPLVNMAALGGFFFPMALHGCSLVLHHPFDPPVFLAQMQDEKITFTIVPPAVLNQLAKAEEMWNRYDFSALRRIGSGAAPLSPWMIQVFGERYGKQIVNFYGSNEGISLFSTPETATEPEVRAAMFPRMGCEGMPWEGITHETVRTRVVKVDSEEEITAAGEPGELLFAGATVFDGYLGRSNDDVFTSDGWFRTGDLVEICGEPPNYYRIVGRCKDIINRGGMKISPSEIDILLEGYPGIAEGAVCSYPDEDMGERVCACIVPAPGQPPPELAQITAFLANKGLAKIKLPERLVLMDLLPRNPVGKVQRHLLEQWVKDHD